MANNYNTAFRETLVPDILAIKAMIPRMHNTQSESVIYIDGWYGIWTRAMHFFEGNGAFSSAEADKYDKIFIPTGNLFVLPEFDRTNHLRKGNYPDSGALTVLNMPEDPETFVRAFAYLHGTSRGTPGPNTFFPVREDPDPIRKMAYYRINSTPIHNAGAPDFMSNYQDISHSASFFRRFMRMNPYGDDAAWGTFTNPWEPFGVGGNVEPW